MAENAQEQTGPANTLGSTLHNALLLLGYTGGSQAAPAEDGMFDKPNSKAFETVLHFLLSKLRGAAQAKKVDLVRGFTLCTESDRSPGHTQDFQGLWPIKDVRQQKDFRKVPAACSYDGAYRCWCSIAAASA